MISNEKLCTSDNTIIAQIYVNSTEFHQYASTGQILNLSAIQHISYVREIGKLLFKHATHSCEIELIFFRFSRLCFVILCVLCIVLCLCERNSKFHIVLYQWIQLQTRIHTHTHTHALCTYLLDFQPIIYAEHVMLCSWLVNMAFSTSIHSKLHS